LGIDWWNLSRSQLITLTRNQTGRFRDLNAVSTLWYWQNTQQIDAYGWTISLTGRYYDVASMRVITGAVLPQCVGGGPCAITLGHYTFSDVGNDYHHPVLWHEYIHTLQWEAGGFLGFVLTYGADAVVNQLTNQEALGPTNAKEAIAYLWQGWAASYGPWAGERVLTPEKPPWCFFKPLSGGTPGC